MNKNKLIIVAASALLLAASAHADVIARWTPVSTAAFPVVGLNYDASSDTPPADYAIPGVTVSVLDNFGAAQSSSSSDAKWSRRATLAANFASDYTSFTLTPGAGNVLSLSSVTYKFFSYGDANTASGYTFSLRSSADGFAADLASQTLANTNVGTFNLNLTNVSSLQSITGATEFRYYIINNNGTLGWADLAGSDTETNVGFIVNGSVAPVPEPATYGTLGAGALAATAFVRRRRKAV